jgi:lipopolysaccharide export system protein LptC
MASTLPCARQSAPPWLCGVQELLSAYLPMVLMSILALGTWWLVKNTPLPPGPTEAVPKRHEPDYQMQGFDVQRFDAKGLLRVSISGRELRHYPDTDTLEIDDVQVRATNQNGALVIATAERGVSNGDGSEVQLLGNAKVQRFAADAQGRTDTAAQVQIEGEFVQVFVALERIRSSRPVRVSYPGGELQASAIDYDNLKGMLEVSGRTHLRLSPTPARVGARR